MNIGDNIRKVRKQKNMTLQQLAYILGCSQQNISQYENGKRVPKIDTLKKIATALDVNVNDLLPNPLEDSPIYRAFKKSDSLDNDLAHDYINRKLTEDIDWKPIDIEMIKIFKTLNETGQIKAIERVEELTEIPRYTQNEKNAPENKE